MIWHVSVSKVLHFRNSRNTFGIGIVKNSEILANAKDMYIPAAGGINPLDAKEHHQRVKEKVLKTSLDQAGIGLSDVDLVAYAAGPGLPPCLKTGAQFAEELAKKIKKPLVAVNHGVAHIEIGRLLCRCMNPIVVYVSGGNTQIIGYSSGRYRVFGETMDVPIGNAIDVFIRETYGKDKSADSFGGPIMEKLAEGGRYIELPYVVKGMELSFSGITTAAIQKWNKETKGKSQGERDAVLRDLCFSFQETCYAMLTEVTERALAHTGKNEVLLVGGVAASKRFREMIEIMCKEREAKAYVCPIEYSGDNGVNIAWTGLLGYKHGQAPVKKPDFNSLWRTDQAEILWMK